MLKFSYVELSRGTTLGETDSIADHLHVFDVEADAAGAPQNIQALHRLIAETGKQIQFRGGIETVHIAELVLGLGVQWVVLDSALRRTELSPKHFFTRLGSQAVGAALTVEEAQHWSSSGCSRILYEGEMINVARLSGLGAELLVTTRDPRNLEALAAVGVTGVILMPEHNHA
jgi:hypothetical protein